MKILRETATLLQNTLASEWNNLTIERATVGIFFTGVKLSNGAGGVCYTPVKDIPKAVCCPSSAGRIFDPEKITGMHVSTILSGIESQEPIKTALAVATLNALSAHYWTTTTPQNYRLHKGLDAIDAINFDDDHAVAVVGAFVPVMKKLKAGGGKWWVIEQDSSTLKEDEMEHFINAADSPSVIAQADTLVITGVTLLNHTLDTILSCAKPGAAISVMGPTASMLPEPCFERGVDMIGGVLVTHPDALLDTISLGGSGYHFLDKYAERLVIKQS